MQEFLRWIFLVGAITGIIYFSYLSITRNNERSKSNIKKEVQKVMEKAFADGQRKVFEKDISFDSYRNCWVKSPWTDQAKKEPITYVKCDN